MGTTSPTSNQQQFGATTYVYRHTEEDPLGILRRVPSSHDRVDKTTGSRRLLESSEETVADHENGNPCDVIDAILRSSQATRDRVSSRQVRQKYRETKHVQPQVYIGSPRTVVTSTPHRDERRVDHLLSNCNVLVRVAKLSMPKPATWVTVHVQ